MRGGLTLALRSVVAHTSCASIGLAMGIDVHRSSVARWAVRLRAARVYTMRVFYQEMYAELAQLAVDAAEDDADDGNENAYSVALHCMQCDATRSGLWKNPQAPLVQSPQCLHRLSGASGRDVAW